VLDPLDPLDALGTAQWNHRHDATGQ